MTLQKQIKGVHSFLIWIRVHLAQRADSLINACIRPLSPVTAEKEMWDSYHYLQDIFFLNIEPSNCFKSHRNLNKAPIGDSELAYIEPQHWYIQNWNLFHFFFLLKNWCKNALILAYFYLLNWLIENKGKIYFHTRYCLAIIYPVPDLNLTTESFYHVEFNGTLIIQAQIEPRETLLC